MENNSWKSACQVTEALDIPFQDEMERNCKEISPSLVTDWSPWWRFSPDWRQTSRSCRRCGSCPWPSRPSPVAWPTVSELSWTDHPTPSSPLFASTACDNCPSASFWWTESRRSQDCPSLAGGAHTACPPRWGRPSRQPPWSRTLGLEVRL